jgi:formylglycine-generating enzyme required for sulfatase activity
MKKMVQRIGDPSNSASAALFGHGDLPKLGRAGTTDRWFFGDDDAALPDYAWYKMNSGGRLHRTGSLRANPRGLQDVYGNVAEWCQDGFRRYQEAEMVDPRTLDDDGLVKAVPQRCR